MKNWHKKKNIIQQQKSKQVDLALYPRDLNVVPSESESSSDDLTYTEPRIQLEPEECHNSSILNFELVPASTNVLHCIELFPERLITARDAVIKMSILVQWFVNQYSSSRPHILSTNKVLVSCKLTADISSLQTSLCTRSSSKYAIKKNLLFVKIYCNI